MDPALVLFAIESAVRLGRKLNDVLVDETHERALLLPLGDLHADVRFQQAQEFFDRPENQHLVAPDGPYAGFDRDELVQAYRTLRQIDAQLGGWGEPETLGAAADIVEGLHRFEQLKAAFGANHPLQRVLGTVVEIGIDYMSANPQALGRDSAQRRVISAFVARLDEIDFAEGDAQAVVGDLLLASLRTLGENVALVDDDRRLQVLLGGVTQAVVGEIESAQGEVERMGREDLVRRIGSSILRGGLGAFSENTGLFLPDDAAARPLVESTLRQLLAGVRGREDLFTGESLEVLFKSALRATGENAALFTDQAILRELIESTTGVLAGAEVEAVFSRETASAILAAGLEVTAENVETLIDTDHAQRQLLAGSVAALAHGLSDQLAGGASVRALLSRRQLVTLAGIVFEEVASHPEQLLGDAGDDPRRTALAQIVASLAGGLAEDPRRLVNGEGLLELMAAGLHVGVRNADKLLDLSDEDPATNLLFRVVREAAGAALEAGDPRKLLGRQVFVEMLERSLTVASANVGPLLADQEPVVRQVVARALELSAGALQDGVNGENLPALVEGLLAEVLRGELDLAAADGVIEAANEILRAA